MLLGGSPASAASAASSQPHHHAVSSFSSAVPPTSPATLQWVCGDVPSIYATSEPSLLPCLCTSLPFAHSFPLQALLLFPQALLLCIPARALHSPLRSISSQPCKLVSSASARPAQLATQLSSSTAELERAGRVAEVEKLATRGGMGAREKQPYIGRSREPQGENQVRCRPARMSPPSPYICSIHQPAPTLLRRLPYD